MSVYVNGRDIFKVERIPYGHETWIEVMDGAGVGGAVKCRLCFGHNLKIDGIINPEKLKISVFDLDEKRKKKSKAYPVEVSKENDCLTGAFIPPEEGCYAIALKYDIGVMDLRHPGYEGLRYYCQYAKAVVPVGCESEGYTVAVGDELEIVLHNLTEDNVILKVLYDHQPLQHTSVSAVCYNNTCEVKEKQIRSRGTVVFNLEERGRWMFLVRHRDPEKNMGDDYLEKVMSASLTLTISEGNG